MEEQLNKPEEEQPVNIVQGACVECNTDLELPLGERVDQLRYHLTERVWCTHCEFWLIAAIRDSSGRYWGRRRIWHD